VLLFKERERNEMKIVTVGDNCMDVYQSSGKAYPGGNPVNVAVYSRGLGATTAYVGWVGCDSYADMMIKAIHQKGVDISRVSKKEGKTAVTHVELVGNDRKFGDYDEGVMAHFLLTVDDLNYMNGFDHVHAGIWGHVEKYLPLFKKMGLTTSFDFSDKLETPLIGVVAPYVDYSFFSYHRDDEFIRKFLKEVQKKGSKVAIATLGENGSIAFDGNQYYTYGIVTADVVDTMGAGDSFISGFVYGKMKGHTIEECLKLGAETAAKTISYFGAW
jgi:fructoselysine 6-kinase